MYWIELKSGCCAAQWSSFSPNSANHFFMDLSGLNREGVTTINGILLLLILYMRLSTWKCCMKSQMHMTQLQSRLDIVHSDHWLVYDHWLVSGSQFMKPTGVLFMSWYSLPVAGWNSSVKTHHWWFVYFATSTIIQHNSPLHSWTDWTS